MANNDCTCNEQGKAFEDWVSDVIKPFQKSLKAGRVNGNPDLYFQLNNHVVLLECKCFQFRERNGKRPRYVVLRRSQIKSLRKLKKGLGGENEIYIFVGILFSGYDMIPFAIEFEYALKHARKWNDKKKRTFIDMYWILNQQPLREWMAEKFNVKACDIVFPEFRKYLV